MRGLMGYAKMKRNNLIFFYNTLMKKNSYFLAAIQFWKQYPAMTQWGLRASLCFALIRAHPQSHAIFLWHTFRSLEIRNALDKVSFPKKNPTRKSWQTSWINAGRHEGSQETSSEWQTHVTLKTPDRSACHLIKLKAPVNLYDASNGLDSSILEIIHVL